MVLQAIFLGDPGPAELPAGELPRHQFLDRRAARHQHPSPDGRTLPVGADLADRFVADFGAEVGADERVIGVVVGGGDELLEILQVEPVVGDLVQYIATIDFELALAGGAKRELARIGDGDGEVFQRFTKSLSVIGHELAHGVTQFTAGLAYRNQAGALNESMSDVFGVLVEQYFKKQSASEANWLIGEGLFTNHVQGVALRSMKAPGTAYDDDVLGKDPQPDSMDTYVRTSADNGGVHINSGIPNKAFYVVASELGGNAWEAPAQIWYGTLTSGTLPPACTFGKFARTTLATAEELFGAGSAEHDAVRKAWDTVKVRV